jgi:hypothetical protein
MPSCQLTRMTCIITHGALPPHTCCLAIFYAALPDSHAALPHAAVACPTHHTCCPALSHHTAELTFLIGSSLMSDPYYEVNIVGCEALVAFNGESLLGQLVHCQC